MTINKFLVMVDAQPPANFDLWKSRGVTGLMRNETVNKTLTSAAWAALARDKGYIYVRSPAIAQAEDVTDTNLIAWAHDDEPDLNNWRVSPETLVANYQAWKKIGPNVPVHLNISGGDFCNAMFKNLTDVLNKYKLAFTAADSIGFDLYPITGFGRPDWIDLSLTAANGYGGRWTQGAIIEKIRELAGDKPILSYVECSDQALSWVPNHRSVTPEEFRALIWTNICHGVKGIAYFPQKIGGGFQYDNVPQNVLDAMTFWNTFLNNWGEVLNMPHVAGAVNGTTESCSRKWDASTTYTFQVNLSSKSFGDQAPWDITVYKNGQYLMQYSKEPQKFLDKTLVPTKGTVVDRAWADGTGWSYRPWEATDADRDYVLENLTVMNTANDKAIYIPVASEFSYLRGKGVKTLSDKALYPDGKGMAFKSVIMRNCVVDGVKRIDNTKITGAHTDGLYINGDPAVVDKKTDFTVENFTVRNCDGSCMPILVQSPTRLGTLLLRNVQFEDTVMQKRLNLKRGCSIDVLRFENCGPIGITPDDETVTVGRIEIINSPGIDAGQLKKYSPNVAIYLDGVQINGAPPTPPPPPPPPPKTVAKVDAKVETKTTVTVTYSDGSVDTYIV